MQAIDQLNTRLDILIRKYAALESENKRLRETVLSQTKELDSLTKKLASAEQEMATVNLGAAIADDSEKENMRRQLDYVIGEIDKILNTLDD